MERPAAILETAPLRRQQILNALFRLIARVGYERATVSQIAAEAQVARGSLHYYFGQKDDVLHALVRALAVEENERWDFATRTNELPDDRLVAFLHVMLRVGDASRRDYARNRAAFLALGTRDEKLRRFLDEQHKDRCALLTSLLEDGLSRRLFRPLDPAGTATAILGAAEGVLLHWGAESRASVIQSSSEAAMLMLTSFFTRPGAVRGG
jgi:AcrR family transcriptional regulator